ncbi:hypothetical protein VE04_09859 [Pseudogymnoascus sp. 24MN13]|nr:hypothetical protein VE04_09859 [Pseudogymnoascus sp. 24MN13]
MSSRFTQLPGQFFNRYYGHPGRLLSATLKTFFLAHVVWEYGYEISPTAGASMLPTFEVLHDWVVSSKAEPGEKVIKRVIGLEGDYVLMNTPGSASDMMIQ